MGMANASMIIKTEKPNAPLCAFAYLRKKNHVFHCASNPLAP